MKKYLLTLLFVVATSNITLAGPYIKTLNEDNPTLSSGFSRNISGGAIEVRSTDDTYTFMSPLISDLDVENKILTVNGINEDGIVEIAKIKYNSTNDYVSIPNVSRDKYGELHKGVYFRDELNYLNEYVFDEKIDVDFDYIFPLIDENVRLVNERGETLLILPGGTSGFFYSGELFYLKYHYRVSTDANYNVEIINLKTFLKDYSTKVANAKADAVNSKSTKTYNIQGMEVDEDAKGIIIENGAKYIKE
ncbi:MAG: hypothetical protein IJ199_06710 [Prevotella sp.]|nr:hypothetical protein [Prevotella sp.]